MKNELLYEIIKQNAIELLAISEKEASKFAKNTIKQIKDKKPDINGETITGEQKELISKIGQISGHEVSKFVAYAKEQGTKMSFDSMEMGILAAGRKDMQNGLAEILDSMKFEQPNCGECNEKMDNRGRSKKKL